MKTMLGVFVLLVAGAVRADDVEEDRVPRATLVLPQLALAGAQGLLRDPVAAAVGPEAAVAAARAAGSALWVEGRAAVQAGALDDRGLYWKRLAARRAFRESCAPPVPCTEALAAFESGSRGMADLHYESDAPLRVALSGFDPFALDERIDQSNPSGVAALRLDGSSLGSGSRRAEVQTVMLPVRFADFDAGLVESVFAPLLRSGDLDLLVTVSMGRDQFDLERFPGRRRSATAADNQGVVTGASSTRPLLPGLPPGDLPGPEFVEFSLPAAALERVQQPYAVRDNRRVESLERGWFEAASLAELDGQTAVSGSGGGYLSNEVSFRTVRLVRESGSAVAVGHVHTPRVQGYDAVAEAAIVDQLRRMLEAALLAAPAPPAGFDVSAVSAVERRR
ncbi:MAG: hypothetical protein RIC56_03210 [Pseudomonadales bacterium]